MKFAFAALIGATSAIRLQEELPSGDEVLSFIWDKISGDGVLDAEELEVVGPKVAQFFDLSEEEVAYLEEAAAEAMADDGVICGEEVLAFVEAHDIDLGNAIFDALDLNGDGDLTKEEAVEKIGALDISIDSADVDAAEDLYDALAGEDGVLQKGEVGLAQEDDVSDDDSDYDSEDSEDDFCLLEEVGKKLWGEELLIGDDEGELEKAFDLAVELFGLDEEEQALLSELALEHLEDDGVIDMDELLILGSDMVSELYGEEIELDWEDVKEAAFDLADQNEDGELDEEELWAAADALEIEVSEEEIDFVLTAME